MDLIDYDRYNINEDFFSCSASSDSYLSLDSDGDGGSTSFSAHERLTTSFSRFPNNLNLVHINAQSIPRHYPDILEMFTNSPVDVILVSESWLKPSLSSATYALPGYKLIRNDRVGKSGGGVAMYLRSDIVYQLITASPSRYTCSIEYLCVEITLNHKRVLLCVAYSPSLRIDYFSTLETLLAAYVPNFDYTLIGGDFNTCLMKADSRASKLRSLFSALNLSILQLSPTHHSPNSNPSLLDLLITSSPDLVATHGQFPSNLSHHDLVFLSLKLKPPRKKSKFLFLRSFKGLDLQALKHDICNADWSCVYSASDIDVKVSLFNHILTQIFDTHAPIRKVKVKHAPAPWLTQDILNMMAKRNRALCQYRKRPTETNLAKYRYLRNYCSRLCRDSKRHHIHSTIDQSSTSQLWKFLASLGIGKSSAGLDTTVDFNELNKHFSKPPISVDQVTKARTISHISSLPVPLCTPLSFQPVTEDDVKKHITAITSTAVGNDDLSPRIISLSIPELLPILTHIFNHSLSTSSFPSAWKRANIIPLPKTPNPSSFSQFRPISILPYLSKVLENIVHNQLSHFLSSNNLLSPFQSGFRPGHSTVTALLKVTDDLRLAMEQKFVTILVLLDFSNAFNAVDFDILLSVLRSLNISSSVIDWFDSYLRERSQRIRYGEATSDWCDLDAGVPQGGVLSPLLFSIFINTVTSIISFCNFHLYADDLQIYRHSRVDDISAAVSDINADLQQIADWAKSFGLLVNPLKSQAIIVGSRYMTQRLNGVPRVLYNGIPIAYTNSAKNLGIIIDTNLSWQLQVNEVSRKIFHSIHMLRRLQNFLPVKTKISLVQSLIFPILDYADSCYLDVTEELLTKLERLQNICIRFVFGLKKYDHVSTFRSQLKWLPIRLRRNIHILSLLYNILYNPMSPSYLVERFNFSRSLNIPCRPNVRTNLSLPSHRTNFFSYSFTVHAVRLWNSLPHTIRDSPTIAIFKRRLKTHYLNIKSSDDY